MNCRCDIFTLQVVKLTKACLLQKFEYPADWFRDGRAWNEAYLVRAFLENNNNWEILLFADFAGKKFQSYLAEHMPLCLKNTGGSLWIKKLR